MAQMEKIKFLSEIEAPALSIDGQEVVTKAGEQTALGVNHKEVTDALVIIGNGTSSNKSNAFVIMKDGSVEGGGANSDFIKEITGTSAKLDPADAKGTSSLAFGANSTTYGPGSVAIGANVSAGTMAYYFDTIDFTNKKITLSTTRRTLLGGNPSYPSSITWVKGDRISIKNGDTNYIMCSTITAVSGNVITVDNIPFTSIASSYQLGIYTLPHDRTVVNVDKPEAGAVQLGFAALAVGGGKDANTRAVGILSTALGYETLAAGSEAFAGGYRTEAVYASLAYGHEAKALGQVSMATGRETTASGMYSSAENYQATASGDRAHAEGDRTNAEGYASHVEGQMSYTKGDGAHAEGFNSTGTSDRTDAGLSDTRHGAFSQGSHTEGGGCLATGGRDHAEGTLTTTTAWAAHAEGNTTLASGVAAHAEGYNTQATFQYAHAEGLDTKATNHAAHAEGYNTTASGWISHAEGNNTEASGTNSHAEGQNCKATLDNSHAGGMNSEANGKHSFAHGAGVIADKESQTVVGKYNKTGIDTIFTVGAGLNGARKNLIEAYAGTMSVNLGLDLKSSWLQTVVGGFNAPTDDTNGLYRFIVGGGNSDTDRKNAMTVSRNGDIDALGTISSKNLNISGNTILDGTMQATAVTCHDTIDITSSIKARYESWMGGFSFVSDKYYTNVTIKYTYILQDGNNVVNERTISNINFTDIYGPNGQEIGYQDNEVVPYASNYSVNVVSAIAVVDTSSSCIDFDKRTLTLGSTKLSDGTLTLGSTQLTESKLSSLLVEPAHYTSASTNTYVEIPFGTNIAFTPSDGGPCFTSIHQEAAMIGVANVSGYMSHYGIIGQITSENADSLTGLFVVNPSLVYQDSELYGYDIYASNVAYSGTITKGDSGYSGNVTMYYLKEV